MRRNQYERLFDQQRGETRWDCVYFLSTLLGSLHLQERMRAKFVCLFVCLFVLFAKCQFRDSSWGKLLCFFFPCTFTSPIRKKAWINSCIKIWRFFFFGDFFSLSVLSSWMGGKGHNSIPRYNSLLFPFHRLGRWTCVLLSEEHYTHRYNIRKM
jgi:hypothetical protein